MDTFAQQQERYKTLQQAHGRLLKKLADSKVSKKELVDAVFLAAKDSALAIDFPEIPRPVVDRRVKTPETAICVLADWQLAKKTKTYSTDICAKRINEYAEKVVNITSIQRADHPVRECRVYLLGDLVEGELIFPGQSFRIDGSLFSQVLTSGPQILGGFVRRMASYFDKVHVVGVIGNHGAIGGISRRESHPETNADAMMYEATRLLLAADPSLQGRVTWTSNIDPGERKWYAVDRVGEKGFMLFHGDQVKGGFAGFPWYGFAKKIQGWRMGAIPEPFDYSLAGHFHTPARMLIGNVTHWSSGTTESGNAWAAELIAAQGTPSQPLLFSHPRKGVTAEYEVHLT